MLVRRGGTEPSHLFSLSLTRKASSLPSLRRNKELDHAFCESVEIDFTFRVLACSTLDEQLRASFAVEHQSDVQQLPRGRECGIQATLHLCIWLQECMTPEMYKYQLFKL